MRIATFLGDISPSAGGGFTFQDDLLAALIGLRDTTPHEFVFYGHFARAKREALEQAGWNCKSIPRERMGKMRRFLRTSFPGIARVGQALGVRSWLQRSAEAAGCHMVWFVTPTEYQPVDMPFVFTVWDLQHRFQPWFPEVSAGGRWGFREASYSEMLPRAAAVIAPNEAGRADLERFYHLPPERILILPHPTPAFALRAAAGDAGCVPSGIAPPFVFYPAQYWPHKNHANLLLALQRLRKEHELEVRLVLVGSDKGNGQYVRTLAGSLGVADLVIELGFVSRETLLALYREADALAYVTLFGPENLPPLEAFALGCPVVASRVVGAEHQLGGAALMVDPCDPADIARGLRAVLMDRELRQELVRKGRARAASWTAASYLRQLFQFFDRFERVRRTWPAGRICLRA